MGETSDSLTDLKPVDQKFTIHRSLELKISEVKNVCSGEKQQNTYCTVHINDDEVQRTPTVYNNTSPIFAEQFEFNPLVPNFNQLKIMVWSDVTEKNDKNLDNNEDNSTGLSYSILPTTLTGDKAVGQIIFPLAFLKSGAFQKEQWFVLQPTFDSINKYNVTGDIRIDVSHTINPDKTHRFEINVKQANDLIRDSNGGLPDPYVACYLLPDIEGKTAQLTAVKKNTINPVFNSRIVYDVANVTENLEINVSIWNWNKLSSNEFLGHCFVPLSDIPVNSSVDKRYTLLSKPARIYHSVKNKGKTIKGKKRYTMVDGDTKLNHRQFIQRLQRSDQKDNVPTTKRSHRLLDTKFYSISFCGHCGGIIWVTKTHLKCGNCNFCCHQQCAKYVSDNCGGVVTLLLKISYNERYVLPLEFYNSFLNVINENQYYLIELFGKLSTEREAAALSLIKIQLKNENLFDCLKALIDIEISEAESSQTLFRANSMVSKVLDVYMKYTGLDYLSAILKDIIHTIVENDYFIEVDPSKVIDHDQKKINESLYNLTKYLENILIAIFSAEQSMSKDWRLIFNFIQEKVIEKFPTEFNVRYTSIAGFIFLRFFAPAVLGPKLFGLIKVYVNDKNARTFTLLAKVIQTLANLSDFNEKELYMCPLNDYINAKMVNMKKYLTDICNIDVECEYSPIILDAISDQLAAYECSKLLKYFTNVESKLIESITSENVLLLKKYIDVSTNLMEYINELKKNEEEANEERMKKKKLSEDFTARMSLVLPPDRSFNLEDDSSSYIHPNDRSEVDVDDSYEEDPRKDNRRSNASLLNDENVKYISEFYKNNNRFCDSVRSKASIANRDTIFESDDESSYRNPSENLSANTSFKKSYETIYNSDSNKPSSPVVASPTIGQDPPRKSSDALNLLDEKKKKDRQKVLTMLRNIPTVGGIDTSVNESQSPSSATSKEPRGSQETLYPLPPFSATTITRNQFDSIPISPFDRLNTPSTPGPFSPFDRSRTPNTASPFDKPRTPFDKPRTPYSASPFDKPRSPFDKPNTPATASPMNQTTSPFDKPRSPFDKPRSPFDKPNTSNKTPKSPFDKSANQSPVSPFDRINTPTTAYPDYQEPTSAYDDQNSPTTAYPDYQTSFDLSRKPVPIIIPLKDQEPSSPFDKPKRPVSTMAPLSSSSQTSSSPFDKPRRPFSSISSASSQDPSSPFDKQHRRPVSTIISPYDSPTRNMNPYNNPERRKLSKEDLIPSTPYSTTTSDCNEFEQAQGRIKTLSIAPTNNPIEEEDTIDIPDSEIQDEIMAKINKNIKYCCMCRMQILSEFITFDNEKVYHLDCFRCERCDDILTSDNCYKKEEKYYCKKCYLFTEGYCCNECEEIIEGQTININGKLYHPQCFVCTACGEKLSRQYMAIDGRPYCKRDYLKYKGFLCGICGEFIENEYISIFDRKYHLNCKKCALCGDTFNNKSFFSLPQDPYEVYCEKHKTELCTCHCCHKPIEDQMIRTTKTPPASYHIHCFKCVKCDKSLKSSDYFEKDQEIYCRYCYISIFL